VAAVQIRGNAMKASTSASASSMSFAIHATQATARQCSKKGDPEGLGFARAHRHAQHLSDTIGVHAHRDYYGHRDDAARLPDFDVDGIDPPVRPVALNGPIQKLAHPFVDLSAQPQDLALADAAHAQRLDQIAHRARGHALHVRFLDHGRQDLLRRARGLQKRRKVAARSQPGQLQVDRAGARVPRAIAVAVAAVGALRALDVVAGPAQLLDIHVHQPRGDKLDHLPQNVDIRPFLGQFRQCHSCLGHRGAPRRLSLRLRKRNLKETRDAPRKRAGAPHADPLRAPPYAALRVLWTYTTSGDTNKN
jgi:hypothetical protein